MKKIIGFLVWGLFLWVNVIPVSAQATNATIHLVNRSGLETTSLVDGDRIKLVINLPAPVANKASAAFFLDGLDSPVAACELSIGTNTCESASFTTQGWFWGVDGIYLPDRVIRAELDGQLIPGSLAIKIKPRPVVMVHGFLSSWETWKPYLGPDGYLASIGLQGFAVGDGQAPGVLNVGSPSDPSSRTNSIAQNAEILKGYIAAVQKLTGAEKVDLLVHSMGGMISRYYIDRVMDADNVAQVIFLGTPMSGSACVYPLASLGYLMPASLEILPDYMTNVFNRQIIHRHGIPFYMVAGTLLVDPLTSPCTSAPSDTVVSLDSATSIQLDNVQKLPMFHGNLTTDKKVFDDYVIHLLQSPPASFYPRPDLDVPMSSTAPGQFSRSYTGHINPGKTSDVTIDIDPNVSLANFSLYDSSRSLEIEVRGASGNIITLDAVKNGLVKIDDPRIMFYLGYGFKNPKPGKWVVTLKATGQTPVQGADYSINARFDGGATLEVRSSSTIPASGQSITISASVQDAGSSPKVSSAQALVRKPDGSLVTLVLNPHGDLFSTDYLPDQAGLHSVEVIFAGQTNDGFGIDRAAFLAFDVQPENQAFRIVRIFAITLVIILVLLAIGLFWYLLKLLRRPRSA